MIGSRAWLDPTTGKVYLSKELLDPNKEYVEVVLNPGPWEGLVEVITEDGEHLIVPSHELIL